MREVRRIRRKELFVPRRRVCCCSSTPVDITHETEHPYREDPIHHQHRRRNSHTDLPVGPVRQHIPGDQGLLLPLCRRHHQLQCATSVLNPQTLTHIWPSRPLLLRSEFAYAREHRCGGPVDHPACSRHYLDCEAHKNSCNERPSSTIVLWQKWGYQSSAVNPYSHHVRRIRCHSHWSLRAHCRPIRSSVLVILAFD